MLQKLNDALEISGSLNRFLSRLSDLILLNFLCFLCCVPVVTIGASVSAMDSVLERYLKKEEYDIRKDFFHSFYVNFKRATIIWIFSMILYAAMAADILICSAAGLNGSLVMMGGASGAIALVVLIDQYSMIMVGQTKLKTVPLLKNAFMISMIGMKFSLILLALNLLPFFILWYSVPFFVHFMFVWILFGISMIQLATVYFYQLILRNAQEQFRR